MLETVNYGATAHALIIIAQFALWLCAGAAVVGIVALIDGAWFRHFQNSKGSKMTELPRHAVALKNVHIVRRNFAGRGFTWRNFCIMLDPETAGRLRREGWNVETEGTDSDFLKVAVSYRGRFKPIIVMRMSEGRSVITEENCGLLDSIDLGTVDVILHKIEQFANGKTNVKTYLKALRADLTMGEKSPSMQ